jgi:hypothetical protein
MLRKVLKYCIDPSNLRMGAHLGIVVIQLMCSEYNHSYLPISKSDEKRLKSQIAKSCRFTVWSQICRLLPFDGYPTSNGRFMNYLRKFKSTAHFGSVCFYTMSSFNHFSGNSCGAINFRAFRCCVIITHT